MGPDAEYEEQTLEMRVVRRADIANYFSLQGEMTGEGRFRGEGWEVELSEEKRVPLGSFKVPATFVTLRCRKGLLKGTIDALRLKFMAYGG